MRHPRERLRDRLALIDEIDVLRERRDMLLRVHDLDRLVGEDVLAGHRAFFSDFDADRLRRADAARQAAQVFK